MANKTKILFKNGLFAFSDMIAARDLPTKSREHIQQLNLTDVKVNYHVNDLAQSLHPKSQEVVISAIHTHDKDTKTYKLTSIIPNKKLAYFRAGQYLSLTVNVNGVEISRPYSISSSPNDAFDRGFYTITIKRKPGGFISSFILDKLKVGDKVKLSGPEGEFYYDDLRDPINILAIAGGSGITPFLSMAKAIVEKTENFNLTILFGNKSVANIIFHKEFEQLEKLSNGKVRVVHVLSEEKNKNFESGFITLDLIKKYMKPNSAIWMCGPKVMYNFILKEITPLNLPQKLVRVEASNDIGLPSSYKEYQNIGNKNQYSIKVKQFGQTFEIKSLASDSILVSLQKARISTQSKCLSGLCSWCRVKVNKGSVFSPTSFGHPRAADRQNNIYYSCATFPITDIEIEAY